MIFNQNDGRGIIPVKEGGTGKKTHTSNSVLTGNGNNAVNNVPSADGAFYSDGTNKAPKFATLPIAQGGTGAKTAADALKNLGITVAANIINLLSGAKSNIQTQLDGKAASSHGNHVPTKETANNARFLRNDNTWQTVTPANIGAATSEHSHNDLYYTETEVNTILGSYLKKYELNAINIDSTGGNWTVDISEEGHGTVPSTWVNVTQTTSGHFYTQIAIKCNKDSNTNREAGDIWIRDKYNGSAWSKWTMIIPQHKYLQVYATIEQLETDIGMELVGLDQRISALENK